MIIQVKVKPNSPISSLVKTNDGIWLAQLKSPPIGGRANTELLSLIAKHFKCRKSAVSVKIGTTSRIKLIEIENPQ